MATITAAVKEALESKSINYNLKFFIQDNNGEWVDFTDFAQYKGRNQLRKLGSISYSIERLRGQLQQRISSVMLDNPNGFWDRPFPANLMASYDSQWRPLPSTAASFSTTTGGKESIIYRHKAAVRIELMAPGLRVPVVHTVGVFLIDGLETNAADRSANMTFAPLSAPLVEASAEKIKNGSSWFQDVSIEFLVTKLLGDTYKDPDTMELPPQYDISIPVAVSSPITGIEGWEATRIGTPLAKTISYSGLTTNWRDEKLAVRAMCLWEYSTGTISVDPTTQQIVGSGTQWNASASDQTKYIKMGDTIVIPKVRQTGDGGSVYGNDGYYTVLSVDSTTGITLDRPVPGSQAESGLSYAVQRLILGSGSNVFCYNITTDTYHQATTGETQLGGSGSRYQVRRLWFNTADTDYPIWGAAVKTPDMDTATYTGYSLKIFRMKWNPEDDDPNTTDMDVDVWGTVDTTDDGYTFDLCDYIVRNGDWRYWPDEALGPFLYPAPSMTNDGALRMCFIGSLINGNNTDQEVRQSPISLPFAQELQVIGEPCSINSYGRTLSSPSNDQDAYLVSWKDDAKGYRNGGMNVYFLDYSATQISVNGGSQESFEDDRPILNAGYYTAFSEGQGLRLRYTFGQRGFLDLCPGRGTKGKICLAMIKEPAADTYQNEATVPYRTTKYYWVDLSQADPGGGAATITAMSSAINSVEEVQQSLPTAVAFNSSGDLYVGTYREQLGLYDGTTLKYSRTMLLKLSTSDALSRLVDDTQFINGPDATVPVQRDDDDKTIRETVITEILPTTYNGNEAVYTLSTHLDRIKKWAGFQEDEHDAIGVLDGGQYSVDLWTSELADAVNGLIANTEQIAAHTLPWMYELYDTDYQLWGLAYTNIGASSAYDRIAFINGGTGNIMAFPLSQQTAGSQPGTIGTNSSTYGEAGCYAGPLWSSATGEAYWVTAPNLARLVLPRSSGLFALCRFSWMISTNVMLADFTGMSAWEALRFMADKANAVYGFDPDGNFFFREKPRHQDPSYTLSTDNKQSIIAASKDRGIAEVVNYAQASPAVMRLGDIETSIQVVDHSKYGYDDPEEDDDKYADGTIHRIDAHCTDTLSHSITLMCVVPGVVRYTEVSTSGDGTRDPSKETASRTFARFRYRVEDASIETSLNSTLASGDYSIDLSEDFDVLYKSRIHVVNVNPNTAVEKTSNQYVGLPLSIGSAQVTVQSEVKPRDYFINLSADLDNVCDYTGAQVQVNDVLMIATAATMNDIEYVRVCEISRPDGIIGVERCCQGPALPPTHPSASSVWLIKNGSQVFVSVPASSQFEKGDQVTIYPTTYGLASTEFTVDPLESLSGASGERLFMPVLNKYVPIGGDRTAYSTGVSLQFTIPTGMTSGDNDKMKFSYGDIVYVKVPGLTLTNDGGSRQLAANQASIARYGKRESQLPANPFLSLQQAKWWVNREVAQDKDPHCILTVKTIWAPWIYPLDIVNVQSSELFPSSVGHTESFSILEMAYSLQEQPTMTLKLRAVNPY